MHEILYWKTQASFDLGLSLGEGLVVSLLVEEAPSMATSFEAVWFSTEVPTVGSTVASPSALVVASPSMLLGGLPLVELILWIMVKK